MNHLLRALAPISDDGWKMLDAEARERLTPALAARRLVNFSGPHGWEYSATNLGRTAPVASALGRRIWRGFEHYGRDGDRPDFEVSAELRDAWGLDVWSVRL